MFRCTQAACRWPSVWCIAMLAAGCSLFPPAPPPYMPAAPPPTWQQVQSVSPSLPGGRLALIDRMARWSHREAIRTALTEGTTVPPLPRALAALRSSRIGHFELVNGQRIFYFINRAPSGVETVQLRFPNGALVALELPEPEEEDDDEEEEDC